MERSGIDTIKYHTKLDYVKLSLGDNKIASMCYNTKRSRQTVIVCSPDIYVITEILVKETIGNYRKKNLTDKGEKVYILLNIGVYLK